MKKTALFFCAFLLSLSACKKKIQTTQLNEGRPSDNPVNSNDNPNAAPPKHPDAFECGSGGFDGTRFYVLKENGDTDYNAYKHTPRTKQDLIDLLKKKTPLKTINTYYITNMDSLFMAKDRVKNGKGREDYDFSGISYWMTCNVETMKSMFEGCTNFNEDLSKWNVGKVTNMESMFEKCKVFNQDLSMWDVGKVTNMKSMFKYCSAFNQALEQWNVGKVTNMSGMFGGPNLYEVSIKHYEAMVFNQPLNNWNVSKVTDMSGMFSDCPAFNQALDKWKVGKVTNMSFMFSCPAPHPSSASAEEIGNYKPMAFNQALNDWEVDNVTDMNSMFVGCSAFNQALNRWKVDNVNNMHKMFYGCKAFNQDISGWEVDNVTNMGEMFQDCSAFDQDLSGWNVGRVGKYGGCFNIFKNAPKMKKEKRPKNFRCNIGYYD